MDLVQIRVDNAAKVDRPFVDKMSVQRSSDNVRDRTAPTSKNLIASQRDQEIHNPCYQEHLLSLKCLDSNQKNSNACDVYFINYKNCKKFWAAVQSKRKSTGIEPILPPPEERGKIKADFLNSR